MTNIAGMVFYSCYMTTGAHTSHTHFHPYTFEKAREAVITIKTLRPTLSAAEQETLAILFDSEAMETIEKSVEEADAELFEPLENAISK